MRNMKIIAGLFFGLLMLTIVPLVDEVRADPPSPHPYDYIYSPGGNGFGHNFVKLVNITFFKNMFQTHTNWILEYKRYSYSTWNDGSSYLSIDKTWNNSGFWKFKLYLNVPVNIYSARFTFGIDINCLSYVEKSGTEIWVNYTANATEVYHCMFNYSDIINIPNLIITKGRTDSKIWFRFQIDTINAGNYVFDPTFGYTGIGTGTGTIENVIVMYYDSTTTVIGGFIPKYFMLYIAVTTHAHKVKCAIYDIDSVTLECQSEEKIIPVSTGWNKFNITSTILLQGSTYYLSAWSNSTTGDCRVYSIRSDGLNHVASYVYAANFPSPFSYDIEGAYAYSLYCYYVSLEPLKAFNTYPVNASYTYRNVTISFDVNHNGGKYNYSFYKKYPGASSFTLIETKNNVANNTYFYKWFNATTSNTNYSWKVSCKNYTFNYWHNYTFWFYINDSTVHLSDTKTNVAGTLTSLRNNTGFWIISIHNSSITKKDKTINSSLVHVAYWVTNTWVDYANSTGTTTPFTYHNNTVNVSSVKQLKLLSTGYHLWDNSSSGILSYTNFINCTGTLQKAWYSSLGKFNVWANITGNTTPLTKYQNPSHATGTHTSFLTSMGYKVYANYTGDTPSITQYQNIVNATGTHQSVWSTSLWKFFDWANYTGVTTPLTIHNNSVNVTGTNIKKLFGSGWHVYTNLTGNGSSCPSCNSTNLTLYENFVDAMGTHQSFYDPLLGWFAWANVTGNASTNGTGNYTVGINLTGFNGYISWSGDHIENSTNISFPVTSNMSINGSVHVDEDAYFLSGMLSFDPAVMILSLFFGFFYIGYESKKRSGGFFMLFAGFLLIALGILVYGMLGYAAVLVVPFALFIMLLGGKKAFYGPETEESHNDKPTK